MANNIGKQCHVVMLCAYMMDYLINNNMFHVELVFEDGYKAWAEVLTHHCTVDTGQTRSDKKCGSSSPHSAERSHETSPTNLVKGIKYAICWSTIYFYF